jgi:hypothetical protein
MKSNLRNRWGINLIATLGMIGLVMILYLLWARPYQLNWGATDEEIERVMPGDELDPEPSFLATRAIAIEGTPEEIWPWLVQMGYGRAGFYGYDILENLGSSSGLDSAEHIMPEYQTYSVGDEVPISAVARMVFYAIEPNQYLIWTGQSGKGAFTWALYPIDESHTRLVSRIRWSHHLTPVDVLALDLFTEFTDHLAVRKILQGVKGRVEGHIEPAAAQNFEFTIFVIAAIVFLYAVFLVLLRPLTWQRWLTGLGAGIVWLIAWYAPVPAWTGGLLILLTIWRLRKASKK